jgi:hypothetical protein
VSGVTPLTFLGTNLGSWRILSNPLAFSFFKKKKKKNLVHFFYGMFACYKVRVKHGFLF